MLPFRKILAVVLLFVSSHALASIEITDFSWSVSPEGLVINRAAAVVTYPGQLCFGVTTCGISVGISSQGSQIQTVFKILAQGTPTDFTSEVAVQYINNNLSNYLVSNTTDANSRVCLFMYTKKTGAESHQLIPGVCSGGGIPPEPEPVSCELNMDNNIFNFGDISATAFQAAGAGGKPAGVNTLKRTLNISCTSATSSRAYLRMTTSKASGNMLVSSNDDVGFLMSAGEDDPAVNPLTPNLSSSRYPVTLDSSGRASVAINAFPVSVTGKKPVAGSFTSNALLEISWD